MLKKSDCAIAAISDDVDGDLGDVDHQQLMRKRVAIDASLRNKDNKDNNANDNHQLLISRARELSI